jgi:hypothetical protein
MTFSGEALTSTIPQIGVLLTLTQLEVEGILM